MPQGGPKWAPKWAPCLAPISEWAPSWAPSFASKSEWAPSDHFFRISGPPSGPPLLHLNLSGPPLTPFGVYNIHIYTYIYIYIYRGGGGDTSSLGELSSGYSHPQHCIPGFLQRVCPLLFLLLRRPLFDTPGASLQEPPPSPHGSVRHQPAQV